jgi:DNA replication protein DnaC
MSTDHDRLKATLRELRLGHMADALDVEVARATKERTGYGELLARLLEHEQRRRAERSRERRLKAAAFPEMKSIEDYDFKAPTRIDARLVRELAALRFLSARESVWIAGPSGTGKTHIAIALGIAAVDAGFSARYASLAEIARALHASIADHTEDRRLRALDRIDLLVIEDLGFAKVSTEAMPLLFELFNRRYQRRSTIVTSNLDGDSAEKSLGNQAIAVAILDRLLHQAHLVAIDGPSYRAEHRLSKRRAR